MPGGSLSLYKHFSFIWYGPMSQHNCCVGSKNSCILETVIKTNTEDISPQAISLPSQHFTTGLLNIRLLTNKIFFYIYKLWEPKLGSHLFCVRGLILRSWISEKGTWFYEYLRLFALLFPLMTAAFKLQGIPSFVGNQIKHLIPAWSNNVSKSFLWCEDIKKDWFLYSAFLFILCKVLFRWQVAFICSHIYLYSITFVHCIRLYTSFFNHTYHTYVHTPSNEWGNLGFRILATYTSGGATDVPPLPLRPLPPATQLHLISS